VISSSTSHRSKAKQKQHVTQEQEALFPFIQQSKIRSQGNKANETNRSFPLSILEVNYPNKNPKSLAKQEKEEKEVLVASNIRAIQISQKRECRFAASFDGGLPAKKRKLTNCVARRQPQRRAQDGSTECATTCFLPPSLLHDLQVPGPRIN
jgi:hypothetical protein